MPIFYCCLEISIGFEGILIHPSMHFLRRSIWVYVLNGSLVLKMLGGMNDLFYKIIFRYNVHKSSTINIRNKKNL